MLRKKNMEAQVRNEISILGLIKHKHVVALYDVFATVNKIFIVLELVEGA
jgi:serine/threonine protein kinase